MSPGTPPVGAEEALRAPRAAPSTARRAAAARRALLAEVTVALSASRDPQELVRVAACALGERLGAARAGVNLVDVAAGTVDVRPAAWAAPNAVPLATERVPLEALGTSPDAFVGGHVLAIDDIAEAVGAEAYANFYEPHGIGAYLGAPCVRDGVVTAVFYADVPTPRTWTGAEVELARAVAELLWAALDRARLGDELAAREAEFREMVDNLPQLAWMADDTGAVFWFNRRWYDYTGVSPAEVQRGEWQDVVLHPGHAERVTARFRTAVAAGAPWEDTFPMRARGGEWRWFLSRANPIRSADGRVTRWFGTNTDLTEQMAAEEEREFLLELSAALQDERAPGAVAAVATERLRERLGAVRATLFAVDGGAGTAAVYCDALGARGRAAGHAEVAGTFPLAALGPALVDQARTGPVVVDDTRADARTRTSNALFYARGGTRAFVAAPLVRDGRPVAAVAVADDRPRLWTPREVAMVREVAERLWPAYEAARARADAEAAREAAEEARNAAEAANTAKSQFLAVMSHELRTPLNAIAGHVQLVEMGLHGPVTPAQREALSRVQRAQRHLLGLINDVLNLAKIETGRVDYDVQALPLAELVADVLPMVEPQLAAKAHDLVVALPGGSGDDEAGVAEADGPALVVWADREKLVQVLLNLLSNAIKFTGPGGRITLAAEPDDPASDHHGDPGDQVRLTVRDTGIGVPPDKLDAIFDPFVQARQGHTRPHEGTGLGLAISRELARGMGGDLAVASAEGAGSVFTLTLRRARDAHGDATDRRSIAERRAEERREADRRRRYDRRELGHELGHELDDAQEREPRHPPPALGAG